MPCYHPNKGFILGIKKDGKTKNILITSSKINHLEKCKNSNEYFQIEHPNLQYSDCRRRIDEYVDIPCGRCIGCRLDYAKVWACRLLCELESQPAGAQSWFVTLTYDDNNVPIVWNGDEPHLSLRKEHCATFMKNLRAQIHRERKGAGLDDLKVRFFCAGEYGSNTMRPHLHMILFNCPINDIVLERIDKNGFNLYSSKWLERVWSFGHVTIGSVTPESCAYVARYCTKKAFGASKEDYYTLGIEPEFVNMSRRPGIGANWLDSKGISLLDFNEIVLATEKGNKTYSFPRYFMNRLAQENANFVEFVKETRKYYFDNIRLLQDMQSSVSYLDRLAEQERLMINKFNKERDYE